ncbi:MAG TPA: serine/threonine-protein kinase [Oculatellaceae cyanobacterium]
MQKPFSLQERMRDHLRHPNPLMEYIPQAELTMNLQRIGRLVLFAGISCLLFIAACAFVPQLKDVVFDFFRFLVAPIKPLLYAQPAPALEGLLNWLSKVSTVIVFVAAPLVSLFTIFLALRQSYLYIDGRYLYRLKLIMQQSNGPSGRAVMIVAGKHYLIESQTLLLPDTKVIVERPQGKKSYRDYVLKISTPHYRDFSIKWGDVIQADDRQRLMNTMEELMPQTFDASVFEPFKQIHSRQSYTEIWLKELSGAPKRDRLTPLADGSKLDKGNYTIIHKAGVGGQGTVYFADTAKNSAVSRTVVLKEFVLPVFPDIRVRKKAAERFQTEAAVLSRLHHPRVVRFIDLFVEDHRAYVVMELVEGANLKELVATSGPLPESEVVKLASQMASVLSYLHEQEPPVIHRDLTPDNIILGEDGLPKLIDFSVAQELSSGVTGSVVGKPNYIAPEQFRGKPKTQSDIYSLGASMYYLLIGQDPPPITVLHPQFVNGKISQPLDHIVAKCTQLDVLKRYQSAAELLADLEKIGGGPHT